jgi:hypothetical protein
MRSLVVIFVAVLFLVTSCCKVGCIYQSMRIHFDGYAWEELDSTLIKKYEPNTNFTTLIDSFYQNSFSTAGDGVMFLDDAIHKIDLSKDYQVVVRVTNRTYNISSITTTGFQCPCETRRGKQIDSYVLDGVRHFQEEVHLKK